jgi:flavin reductase (DIM6/NTAB) family NADH-FMN oxidoreductase RutF
VSVDSAAFRRALGQFASGVTVLTTRGADGQPRGLTVSAFCSVSLHPPLVLACVDRRADANAGLRESGLFAISVLGEDQEDVSRRFALRGAQKFSETPLVEGRHDVPLVKGALAHLECRVRSFHEEGDHTVWVGEVLALSSRRGRPLVYQAGAYRKLAPEASRGGASGPDRV